MIVASLTRFTLAVLLLAAATNARGFVGFQGDYCATRPPARQCCTSRDDACTAPIRVLTGRVRRRYDADGRRQLPDELEMMDHLCYCDRFCRRDASDGGGNDCCPDYSTVCENSVPFESTVYRDQGSHTMAHSAAAQTSFTGSSPLSSSENECFEGGVAYGYGQTIQRNCQTCTCFGNRWDCDSSVCLIQETLIRRVREERHTWTAQNYSQFWGRTLGEGVRYRLGTLFPERSVENMNEILVRRRELPRHFDARRRWPALDVPPRDQGDCASSWAFSTTEVAADRLTILATGGFGPRVDLSAQQLIDCNSNRQRGCQGGFLDRAWWYIRKLGIVSNDCYPYTSGVSRSTKTCRISRQSLYSRSSSPTCVGNTLTNNTVFKMTPPYRISVREEDIRAEILMNGPVQATFLVCEDFFMYGGGIYRRVSTRSAPSGYHSVKIIGWGDEPNGQKYWICANSWGPNWGENGYFRIVRGENHCEIESFVIGAWGIRLSETAPALLVESAEAIRQTPAPLPSRSTRDFWHFTTTSTTTTKTTTTATEYPTTTTTEEVTTTTSTTTSTERTTITTAPTTTTSVEFLETVATSEKVTTSATVNQTDSTVSSSTTNAKSMEEEQLTSKEYTDVSETMPTEIENDTTTVESETNTALAMTPEGVDYLDEDLTTKTTMPTTVMMETTTVELSDEYDEYGNEDNVVTSTTVATTTVIVATTSTEMIEPTEDLVSDPGTHPTKEQDVTSIKPETAELSINAAEEVGGSWGDELETPAGCVTECTGGESETTETPPIQIKTPATVDNEMTTIMDSKNVDQSSGQESMATNAIDPVKISALPGITTTVGIWNSAGMKSASDDKKGVVLPVGGTADDGSAETLAQLRLLSYARRRLRRQHRRKTKSKRKRPQNEAARERRRQRRRERRRKAKMVRASSAAIHFDEPIN